MLNKKDPKWQKLTDEILSGIAEWREQHRQATFTEIERETMRRIAQLQAKLVEDLAQASQAADWQASTAPICPKCGAKMGRRGEQERSIQVVGGEEVKLKRAYAVCPSCGEGIFPLDEELELLPGGLSPYTHEIAVRLGGWMPFRQVTHLLADILRVTVSKSQVERCTESAGAAYVTIQTEEADKIEQQAPLPEKGSDKMVLSADGANVPLLHGEWAEVKTLVIGDVMQPVQERGESVVHTRNLSYFSRLVSSDRFQHLTLTELHRRGIENCQQVGAVMDGAEWLQGLIDYHCPKAVRILDFPHAGQRIGQVAEAIWGQGNEQAKNWTAAQLHKLKHEGPNGILSELRQLQERHPKLEVLQQNLAYLEKRVAQMQYPHFQQQGLPIGSGIVESGNKLVVEARLKGAGMHWKRENVDPMLALRNIICSDRWSEAWTLIAKQLRQEAKQRRRELHQKHSQSKVLTKPVPPTTESVSPEPERTTVPCPSVQPVIARKSYGPGKPAANHPWRRSPFGRQLYQPSIPAKN
jgi:YgiT-type zinc finger domain-containing protein